MTSSNGSIFRATCPCKGNPLVIGGFPSQRPVTRSLDVFFDLRLNKRLSKQSRRRWFKTPSHSLLRHSNGFPKAFRNHDIPNYYTSPCPKRKDRSSIIIHVRLALCFSHQLLTLVRCEQHLSPVGAVAQQRSCCPAVWMGTRGFCSMMNVDNLHPPAFVTHQTRTTKFWVDHKTNRWSLLRTAVKHHWSLVFWMFNLMHQEVFFILLRSSYKRTLVRHALQLHYSK